MLKKFEWFLIAGGFLWIVLWTGHTIAHGPLNPAPETGRFLGMSSMFYATWLMFLVPVPLSLGWIGLHRFTTGGWRVVRTIGFICTILSLLLIFIAGCISILAFIQQGFVETDFGPVWYIYALGQLMLLAGTFLFGIGLLKGTNFGILVKLVPIAVVILIPLISYLRRPGSTLLEWGPVAGYVLLESMGALLGICWIILGLASYRSKKCGIAGNVKPIVSRI